MRAGRTFITNGPALWLEVAGRAPGAFLDVSAPGDLPVTVRWESQLPLNRVEVVHNGRVVARQAWPEGQRSGTLSARVPAAPGDGDGWLAARCFGDARTSYGHFLWAHTSPVYLRARSVAGTPLPAGPAARAAAARFVDGLDASLRWIGSEARFRAPEQRDRTASLFRAARETYARLAGAATA